MMEGSPFPAECINYFSGNQLLRSSCSLNLENSDTILTTAQEPNGKSAQSSTTT